MEKGRKREETKRREEGWLLSSWFVFGKGEQSLFFLASCGEIKKKKRERVGLDPYKETGSPSPSMPVCTWFVRSRLHALIVAMSLTHPL